jgi:hypothetical protein
MEHSVYEKIMLKVIKTCVIPGLGSDCFNEVSQESHRCQVSDSGMRNQDEGSAPARRGE